LVLPIAYSQNACTDFDAKYAKRRGATKGCTFGVAKPVFKILTTSTPKTANFGADIGQFFSAKTT